MVLNVQPIDFDTAVATPEGRLELAREYFAAHKAFFMGAEDERMNKIYAACREEIAELARESLKEKIVPRPGIKILFPAGIQAACVKAETAIGENRIAIYRAVFCARVLYFLLYKT